MPARPLPRRFPPPVAFLRPAVATHPHQAPRTANVPAYRLHMQLARAVRLANVEQAALTESLTLPLHDAVQSGRQPLELIPMDDIPRRAIVPPCRQKPAEPCGLAMFLVIVIVMIVAGSSALILLFQGLIELANIATDAWRMRMGG